MGAGSAGCVLANRLSENPSTRVLLLEAGPRDTNLWIHVPLGYGKLFARTDVNWAYESEPEPALNGRRIFTPRGKVLGGSSSINGLVYIRGQREDFDGWRIPGWGFDQLLPYFEKGEGQLKVSDLERHELCDAFIASAAALGIPRNDDLQRRGATPVHTRPCLAVSIWRLPPRSRRWRLVLSELTAAAARTWRRARRSRRRCPFDGSPFVSSTTVHNGSK